MDVVEIDGRIAALTQQRNQAMDTAVVMYGNIEVLRKRISELEELVKAKPTVTPE